MKGYRNLLFLAIAAIGMAVAAVWAVNVKDWPDFTGFDGKTAWDLAELAIVPILVAVFAYYLNKRQKSIEEALVTARTQEAEFQSYLDRMTDLLLREKPFDQQGEIETRNVIVRARTLSVLKNLDPLRKASVLRFLYESKLLNNVTDADFSHVEMSNGILPEAYLFHANFNFADLSFANLKRAVLSDCSFLEADLSFGKFREANLTFAKLRRANLREINLVGADLSDADLTGSDLRGADLTNTKLIGTVFTEANLKDARLHQANYDATTKWPSGYVPNQDRHESIANTEATSR